MRQRRVKSDYKPWLTNQIKKLSYQRDFLKKQAVKFRSAAYDAAYKRHKNYVNKLIKTTKEDYFKTKLGNAKNSYDSWQAINSLLNKRSKTTEIPELQIENRSVKGNENIASCFNDYFSTIGSKLASNVTGIDSDPLRFVPPVANTFYFQNISALELTKTIAQIKIKKSPGIDGISAKLLKDAGDTINFNDQSGFRQYHSTETTLLDSTSEWLGNMDKGLINEVLFLDLKKAFATVNHKILLSKLELYGIRGHSLDWFRSYFTNRKQGSNLRPFLFLLYINYLPNCLETTKARLFADDTTLSATGSTVDEIETKLNHDLVNVDQWLVANKLTLNEGKLKRNL
ncbi:Hypothetical predicted protein [Paramuricea clavata]|uniref:Reverse transcriptase domain-containing protein n=1 Tax=Paramuricea clavata TaxID=317549 RepID=A0A7D9D9C1_PARCT|nr:Hypothetical predicted protein [Paramuricea clavata]